MTNVIGVSGLTRRFGDLVAVDHVSFSVEEGEIFGFLGPNAAGKTTTVRMLTGVLEPTEGKATIQGHDIRREPLLAREHLGIVPEEANVYLDLTVWRNVMLMGELYGVGRKQQIREGQRLLEVLGLAERTKHKARQLSKGLRQRLMLCTALVTGPEVLFLDEPTTGLDVASTRVIRDIIAQLNRDGLTVFLTTHNMDEAEEMCNRVAIINHGRIAAIDTPERLRTVIRSRQYVEVRFAAAIPEASGLEALPGVSNVIGSDGTYQVYTESPGRVAAELVRLADAKGWEIAELCTHKPSLEEVFVYLTSEQGKEARDDRTE